MTRLIYPATFRDKICSPVVLLALSLSATIVITMCFALSLQDLVNIEFDKRSTNIIRTLNTRLQSYSFLLKGIQSVMSSNINLSQAEYTEYLRRFVNPAVYPGLLEAGYQGDTNYSITYQKSLPADLYLKSVSAREHARDSGTFSTAYYKNKFVLVYLPVYNSELPRSTLIEKREALRGVAFLAIDLHQMVDDLMQSEKNIGITIIDSLHFSTGMHQSLVKSTILTRSTTYQFFDHSWPIEFVLYPNTDFYEKLVFLLCLFVFGIISSLFVYKTAKRHLESRIESINIEQEKDEFVAIASHELKTPLTSIKALNQLLADKLSGENNQLYDSYFRKTDSQIRRMEHLINDLMDVSKIRANKLDYTKTWFDLDSLIRSISEDMQEVKKTHRITVNGSLEHQVYADKDRVTQVITNLMNNAIKYSPQGNLVIISLKETGNEAIISMQDFGIGITNDNQKRIFDRFYRVSADEKKYQGMGIGLFISAEIVRRHNGRIWVKSTKGKGSTFFFSLPVQ